MAYSHFMGMWPGHVQGTGPVQQETIGPGLCRTVKVTVTEPYYIRAVPATKASLQLDKDTTVYIG